MAQSWEGYREIGSCRTWLRANGDGPDCVLVLHGGPGASSAYLEKLDGLVDWGLRVVWFDQIGSGRSRVEAGWAPTIDSFVEQVESVRLWSGSQQVSILGQAWGAMLGVEYALAFPNRVKRLVLYGMSPSVAYAVEDFRRLSCTLPGEHKLALAAHERRPEGCAPSVLGPALDAFNRQFVCRLDPWPTELTEMVSAMEANPVYLSMWGPGLIPTGTLTTWDREEDLHGVDAPALVTVGRYDACSPAGAERIAARMPHARLHVFEKSAHYAHLEEPDEFLRVVGAFLTAPNPFGLHQNPESDAISQLSP